MNGQREPLRTYLVLFSVDTLTTEEQVRAYSQTDAVSLLKKRYPGHNIKVIDEIRRIDGPTDGSAEQAKAPGAKCSGRSCCQRRRWGAAFSRFAARVRRPTSGDSHSSASILGNAISPLAIPAMCQTAPIGTNAPASTNSR